MEKEKFKILLVDDEPRLLDSMQKILSAHCDQYEFLLASSGEEALEILLVEEIFLVVSDICMKEISGLHLLSIMREKYSYIDVILMTGYATDKIRKAVADSGCLYFLEKPFDFKQLHMLISNQIAKRNEGFAGTLKNIQLNDLIQMCCLSVTSMAIRVCKNKEQGIIYIDDGEIVHAECGDITGENAFYVILGWESGSFETLGKFPRIKPTIEKGYQFLLMEAARKSDENENGEKFKEPVLDHMEQARENDYLRIVIVDDSQMMCKIISDILVKDEKIEITGIANNGEQALHIIDELKPDLITLDVNMPVMDGSTALKHIMVRSPCPVVIISSISSKSWMNILDFLCLGAVDYIGKPVKKKTISSLGPQIIKKIRCASKADIGNFIRAKSPKILKNGKATNSKLPCERIVVIYSGAGGYAELIKVLPNLTNDNKTCVISLISMPDEFVNPFSDYLDKRSKLSVMPLESGSRLFGGICYVGCSTIHLASNYSEEEKIYKINRVSQEEVKTNHRDSNFNFISRKMAEYFSGNVIVILLSGADVGEMENLHHIKDSNGTIIIQELASCMVPQNLKKVLQADLIDFELNPFEIVKKLNEFE